MRDTDAVPAATLEEFAPQSTTACSVCVLPQALRDELERARAVDPRRFTYPIISAWLDTHGQAVSDSSLRRHFNRGHHGQDREGGQA